MLAELFKAVVELGVKASKAQGMVEVTRLPGSSEYIVTTIEEGGEYRCRSHRPEVPPRKEVMLSSDEGVDFVLDLCNALRVELPQDFKPFIHESGDCGRRVSEMIERVEHLVANAGTAA